MIDLHTHTHFSDGEHAPTSLVQLAQKMGIRVLAITDHDTLDGIAQAQTAAKGTGIEIVPGIELSTQYEGREVHLLGHFVDTTNTTLLAVCQQMQIAREQRMEGMLQKLETLHISLSKEEVAALSPQGRFSRAHLAQALVKKGVCKNTFSAFELYLKAGKPAWLPLTQISTMQAIAWVHQAHGTASLAHPNVSHLEAKDVEALCLHGLDGIETDHPEHSATERKQWRQVAQRLQLVSLGGSDFHGKHSNRPLGCMSTSPEEFLALQMRRP
ncbi:MAG: PHP domain-containing protein [Proteobacteria bacterium]|nr:PHP domain-containing protein [Cystobacterineae bacterium]MCL2259411.1 PHP domain-containing protein [Cystobacterineae bacterium]MCL2314148.1 PHP domain-containing protein [Pseudomonadota bacterium]